MKSISDESLPYTMKRTKQLLTRPEADWLEHFRDQVVSENDFARELGHRLAQYKQQERLRAAVRDCDSGAVRVRDMMRPLWHRCNTWAQFVRDVQRMVEMLVDQHHAELVAIAVSPECMVEYVAKKDVLLNAAEVKLGAGAENEWVALFSAQLWDRSVISIGDLVRISAYAHGLYDRALLKKIVVQLMEAADFLIAAQAAKPLKPIPLGAWAKAIAERKAAAEMGAAELNDEPYYKAKTASQTSSECSGSPRSVDSSEHSDGDVPMLQAFSESDDSETDDDASPSASKKSKSAGGSEQAGYVLGGPGLGAPTGDAAGPRATSTPQRQSKAAVAAVGTTPASQEPKRKRVMTDSPRPDREVTPSKGGSKGGSQGAAGAPTSAVHLFGPKAVGAVTSHERSDSDGTSQATGSSKPAPLMFVGDGTVWIDQYPVELVNAVLQHMLD
jgi:hypothetical protein